jgi:hypothetical protein
LSNKHCQSFTTSSLPPPPPSFLYKKFLLYSVQYFCSCKNSKGKYPHRTRRQAFWSAKYTVYCIGRVWMVKFSVWRSRGRIVFLAGAEAACMVSFFKILHFVYKPLEKVRSRSRIDFPSRRLAEIFFRPGAGAASFVNKLFNI